MYWVYNILLIIYWIGLIPVILYRLAFEEGFYERIRQSAGLMPDSLMRKIEGRRAIWVHAASVGEIVATSPIVKDIKKKFPEAVVVVSVVTATGHAMAHRIIPEAEGIIFFPLDLPFLTQRILDIIKPITILLVETEIWPNFLRIAEKEKIPVMMVNGRISDRSMKRYMMIRSFTKEMLASIQYFCMQSKLDAEYIQVLGAAKERITVTGNTKYDQTYAQVTEEEKRQLQDEFGFGRNHPIIVAGSTHRGEEEAVLTAFNEILKAYPEARLLIAPREIMRGNDVKALAEKNGLRAICRSTMTGPVHVKTPVVVLDTIGELGRLYSLGDIIFVGGSLVKTGGHNILEPAAHGKPILVGPHMFNFKEIYSLLSSRHACLMVKDTKELVDTMLLLCRDKELRDTMGQNCLDIVHENRGATQRNTEELRKLFESHQIIP
ncbi:3-deoxy-D-manno-octulosonic acid transferase [Veillonella sp. R32]|uniref:3-deoxy-D-manno-octulosonic acid transferase n=1 Tax=Veillonella sp. R32 TaxID=2021312 RepID=UPI00138A283E|nr:3-deoxy-D-manno-octulosonic acid transferase [Veillonella sp. R32]KAF1683940.1 3-deoxy-D-manno-octulosonic acid transferase [Veillonella sp. R32]